MFDELWSEIQDAPGEIFDVIEWKEECEKDDKFDVEAHINGNTCLLYTSPSPRDRQKSRMPSSA